MKRQFQINRTAVVTLLIFLFAITYLDRVCISVAGPRIQKDLHIGPVGWGWVTGVFTISYCLFEIPTGALGDRIGARRVLTRIVLWWSAFTAITGAATGYYSLIITRFFFGAGEAGAFPNASVVVSRWFRPEQRATMSGVELMASQIGGALAPLMVVPIQSRYGWRASFFVFGALGVGWAAVWYTWFRDSPAEKESMGRSQGATALPPDERRFPWREALRSPSVLALLATAVAACANLGGETVSDALVRRMGLKRGRRALGSAALACAGLLTIGVMITRQQVLTVVLLSLVYGAITFQQSGVFGVCIDIGKKHAGAMVGLMNTPSQVGGLLGSVAYGYIEGRFGSYDAPFAPMAGLLFVGAILWLKIDASTDLSPEPLETGSSISLISS